MALERLDEHWDRILPAHSPEAHLVVIACSGDEVCGGRGVHRLDRVLGMPRDLRQKNLQVRARRAGGGGHANIYKEDLCAGPMSGSARRWRERARRPRSIHRLSSVNNLFFRHYLHSKENLNAGIFYKKNMKKESSFKHRFIFSFINIQKYKFI
jgi:hypothetical protein